MKKPEHLYDAATKTVPRRLISAGGRADHFLPPALIEFSDDTRIAQNK